MLPPGLPLRGSSTQAHTRGPTHRLWLALPGACPNPTSGQAHPLPSRVPSARLQTADSRHQTPGCGSTSPGDRPTHWSHRAHTLGGPGPGLPVRVTKARSLQLWGYGCPHRQQADFLLLARQPERLKVGRPSETHVGRVAAWLAAVSSMRAGLRPHPWSHRHPIPPPEPRRGPVLAHSQGVPPRQRPAPPRRNHIKGRPRGTGHPGN